MSHVTKALKRQCRCVDFRFDSPLQTVVTIPGSGADPGGLEGGGGGGRGVLDVRTSPNILGTSNFIKRHQ